MKKFNINFCFFLDEVDELTCFIHNVSPVKKGSITGAQYFNCTLQMKEQSKKAVCFSPAKQKRYNELETSKSPVKLSKYNLKKGEVMISNTTFMKPLDPDKVDFKHNMNIAKEAVVMLGDLEQLANGQLVNVKVKVIDVSDPGNHHGFKGVVQKQELLIADSTGCRKLHLYEDYVGKLQGGKSYLMKNLRLHIVKTNHYLNTALNEEFEFQVVDDIKNVAKLPSDLSTMTVVDIVGKIVALSSLKKLYICLCGKKVSFPDDGLVKCDACHKTMLAKSCAINWSLALMISDISTDMSYPVYFSNDHVRSLASLLQFELEEENEIAKTILMINTPLKVSFDIITNYVKTVAKV